MTMQVGESLTLSMRDALSGSVRSAASRIKKKTGQLYRTTQSKQTLKINVTRIS